MPFGHLLFTWPETSQFSPGAYEPIQSFAVVADFAKDVKRTDAEP